MIRSSFRNVLLLMGAVLVIEMWVGSRANAQPSPGGYGPPNGGSPVYQPYGSDRHRRDDRREKGWGWRDMGYQTPAISSGSFQRPYPYHLDYYKMRYGGSYAPYFGNLYGTPFGTPQVVNYPPYYGPYYNGAGVGAGAVSPYGGAVEYPMGVEQVVPGATMETVEAAGSATTNTTTGTSSDSLPTPKQ